MTNLLHHALRRCEIISELNEIKSMRKGSLNSKHQNVKHKNGEVCVKGPYYELTKMGTGGKTVSQSVPANEVNHMQKEVDNYKRFRQLTDEYVEVCEKISILIGSDEKKKLNLAGEFELEIYKFATKVAEMKESGEAMPFEEIEKGFRFAALRGGNLIFDKFLSNMEDPAPMCQKCGSKMNNRGKRDKRVVSLLGEGTVSRHYYECMECGHHYIPKDALLDIENTSFTPGVRRVVSKLAACDSFEDCSAAMIELCGIHVPVKDIERIAEMAGAAIEAEKQKEIEKVFSLKEASRTTESVPIMYIEYDGTGVPVRKRETDGRKGKQADGTAKTREVKLGCIFTQTGLDEKGKPVRDENSTTYFGAIETSNEFSKRLYMEAVNRGVDFALKVVVLGDGAKWIWTLAAENFPSAVEIIDLYHARERLWEFIKKFIINADAQNHLKDDWYKLLDKGHIKKLTSEMKQSVINNEGSLEDADSEINYFTENTARMQYANFKKQGLFVGSGVIEAGCKNVIGKRLKQSGMHWSVDGANAVIALRCAILSGQFDEFETKMARNL